MAGMTRLSVASAVWIGVLLLVSSTVNADTKEDPLLEKVHTDSHDAPTNKSPLNKVPSIEEAPAGLPDDELSVDDLERFQAKQSSVETTTIKSVADNKEHLQSSGSQESLNNADSYRAPKGNSVSTSTVEPDIRQGYTGFKNNDELHIGEANNVKLNPQPSLGSQKESVNKEDILPRLESRSQVSSASRSEEILERKSTTSSGVQNTREEKKSDALESKNSEAADLGKSNSQDVSLINDTNVNYTPHVKSKDPESTDQSRSENDTRFIPSGVTHEEAHPKEEVEVVSNVTHPLIERILTGEQVLETNTQVNDPRDTAEVNKPDSETREERGGGGGESKLTGAERIHGNEEEQTTLTPESNLNSVPRARTIAFSGVNEFPSVEQKTTASPGKETDVSGSKKNTSTDKTLEQKPYPYLKSTREPIMVSPVKINLQESENSTTEENSPYENTIVRDGTEKKVVTEPSVVLENSIQQFKPDHSEKLENESSKNSTAQASTSTSTLIIPDVEPTNKTVTNEASSSPQTISEEKSTSKTDNEVPREGSEVITKDGNFDVTGNGITEVSPKPETVSKEASYETPFRFENGTTEVPSITSSQARKKIKGGSNADVQTDAEESLLIRSTLNATEVSTEYPLLEKSSTVPSMNFSTLAIFEDVTVTPLTNSSRETSTGTKVTADPSRTQNVNRTIGISRSQEEVTPTPMPTTAGVEYEFVGLTEATVLVYQNATEKMFTRNSTEISVTELPKTTIVPDVQDSFEDGLTTIVPETPTDNPSTEPETTSTYDTATSFTTIVTEETMMATTQTTLELKVEESTTILPMMENRTDKSTMKEEEDRMTTIVETWTTSAEEEPTTVISTENPLDPSGIKKIIIVNSTEASTVVPESTILIMTTSIEGLEISTSSPFVPSTPKEHVLSTSGEMPGEETTDMNQNLSPDEITLLVQIVVQGTLREVCPKLDELRAALAELLRSGTNKSVHARQVIVHQNPCSEQSTSIPTDIVSILVYVVDEEGKFDSTMTNILPRLYNSSSMSFPVTIQSFLLVQEKDSGNAIAVVVVSSVAFICLVLLAGLLFIMRKRQTRFNYGERCRPVSLDAYSVDSVSAYNSVRRKGAARSSKRSYGNPTFEDSSAIPSHPLNFAGLSTFCNDVNAINEEFTGIPQVTAKIDELPPGAEVKNRYANVIPLPETRVPLQKINNDPLTEYINASYVRGPRNATRYYIACQAPMDSTVTDFWRMIWEQQSKVIIMLTDLVENDVEKCTEYIPPSEVTDCHRLYGDFQVTLKKRETKEKYAISTLHLKNLENNTFREVYHIWYLWPVNGVQSDGAGLIAVILEARALQRGGPGPIVVHCSPGTGRTGTLIALDLGIRQYEITRTVDVPRVVYTIRRDRAGAVQTKEQYAFIYKALNLYATKLAGGVLEST